MVEGEEEGGGVQAFGRKLGFTESAGDDIGERSQGRLNLGDGIGILGHELFIGFKPVRWERDSGWDGGLCLFVEGGHCAC